MELDFHFPSRRGCQTYSKRRKKKWFLGQSILGSFLHSRAHLVLKFEVYFRVKIPCFYEPQKWVFHIERESMESESYIRVGLAIFIDQWISLINGFHWSMDSIAPESRGSSCFSLKDGKSHGNLKGGCKMTVFFLSFTSLRPRIPSRVVKGNSFWLAKRTPNKTQ